MLLVACVSLASLMLARASALSYEMGVMVALGARRAMLFDPITTRIKNRRL